MFGRLFHLEQVSNLWKANLKYFKLSKAGIKVADFMVMITYM